jgi:hypothetical protein
LVWSVTSLTQLAEDLIRETVAVIVNAITPLWLEEDGPLTLNGGTRGVMGADLLTRLAKLRPRATGLTRLRVTLIGQAITVIVEIVAQLRR